MKRGIISIILILVLALGPVGSVAAATNTGDALAPSLMSVGEEIPVYADTDEGVEQETEEPEGEEPKDEEPGDEEPKDEEPKDEEPKDEEPKDEEPKDEDPKDDEPKDEEPKDDEPKDEEPKDDEPKDEDPKDEDPKDEEPKDDEPKDEEPKDEEPKDGQPKDEKQEDDVTPDEEQDEDPDEEFSCTITFDGHGATSGSMEKQECNKDKGYKLNPNTFVKTGCKFSKWTTNPDGTGTSYKDKDTIDEKILGKPAKSEKGKKNAPSGDAAEPVTLYAQWEEEPYTITYILNGGTNDPANPAKYTIETATITLKAPKRNQCEFEGWFSDEKFTTKVNTIAKGSTGEKKFYAKWREYTYSIVYDGNGATSGSMSSKTGIKYSESVSLNANKFKKKGYSFSSWNTQKNGSGTRYKDQAVVQSLTTADGGQVNLYAQWSKEKYTIKYHLKGGKNNSKNPKTYTISTKTIKLKDPTRKGYTFVGWYKNKACTKKIKQIKKGSTGAIEIYAKWKANKYKVEYIGNGATSGKMSKTSCRYGKEYRLSKNKFKRTGYTFVNWNRKRKGTGVSYKNKAKFSNLTSQNGKVIKMYAQWKPIKYKVKFDGNGATDGSMKKVSCTYDVSFELPKNKFKRENYNFKGWSTKEDGSGEHFDDRETVKNLAEKEGEVITLYARWEYDSDDDQATIWNFLSDHIGNDYGAAGVMGNLYAESGLRSNNLENMYNERYGMSDEEYTSKVDNGEYGNFVNDHAGYGIAQWTFYTRKQGLLDFARDMGTSISNLHMQLEYLWKELTETYGGLLDALRSATSVRDASDKFMSIFENPADQSEAAKQRRAGYGSKFFSLFH